MNLQQFEQFIAPISVDDLALMFGEGAKRVKLAAMDGEIAKMRADANTLNQSKQAEIEAKVAERNAYEKQINGVA